MVWGKRLAREGIFCRTHSLLMKLRLRRARGIDRNEFKACHGYGVSLRDRLPPPEIFFYAHYLVPTRRRVESVQLHGRCAISWMLASPGVHQFRARLSLLLATRKLQGIERPEYGTRALPSKDRDDGQRDEV